MPEPGVSPLSPPGTAATAVIRPKKLLLGSIDGALRCGLLGLVFLWDMPGLPAKIFGAVVELIALGFAVRFVRRYRENHSSEPYAPLRSPVQAPESYAELQAAMARLREAEDQEHRGP